MIMQSPSCSGLLERKLRALEYCGRRGIRNILLTEGLTKPGFDPCRSGRTNKKYTFNYSTGVVEIVFVI